MKMAIQDANLDVGGRLIEMAETEFMVRGQGYITLAGRPRDHPHRRRRRASTLPILLSQVARGPSWDPKSAAVWSI